jgi:hypothetical protein
LSFGDRTYQLNRAWHHKNPIVVICLSLLEPQHFGFRMDMRRHTPYDFDGPHAMGNINHFLLVNSMLTRPGTPLAVNRTRGIYQDTVEIKEYGRAV